MNYEKLNVDTFIEKAKEGKYSGLTGARRAIGKTDWSEKDKATAHAFADKFFANGAHAVKAARTPKPAKPKGEKAPRTIKKAKRAAKPAKVPATSAPKRAPAAAAPRPVRSPVTSPAATPAMPRLMHGDDPSTVRQHAASSVIAALRNTGPLNAREQLAYDISIVEYADNARESARRVVEAASGGLPFPDSGQAEDAGTPPAPSSPAEVTVPADTPPRIAPPPAEEPPPAAAAGATASEIDLSTLSPEVRAQHERLRRAAAASKGMDAPPPR